MDSRSGNTEKVARLDVQLHPSLKQDDLPIQIFMWLETSNYLNRLEANQFDIFTQKFHKSVSKTFDHFKGRIVRQENNTYLVLFTSVTNAVLCALKIQANYKYITPKVFPGDRKLKIGISAAKAEKKSNKSMPEVITRVSRMCAVVEGELIITSAIKRAYEQENKNALIDQELIRTLKQWEERFLDQLMEYIEKSWNTPNFSVSKMSAEMGWSKSQLYRKLIKLTGKSPNTFIREYRLQRALGLLHKGFGNVSKIASESGFRSPSYFSKCFLDKFGILPSKYAKQHI
ncbi:helix-turn-helix domain-containing protein [Muriicola sp. Z0-33]|uniref:helix-turn-helix domain-containing protein n=1 Tax=Muriicola sp. Z0-33 TaxID=2816957 RepID=UPI00223879A9|nr:AraC family transcriptional regulator [Muriicola sp. Z0-33]MCW5515270.1 helix-turn-helix transcriptional regulator [Muriicola sp. Z0-33]